MLEVKNIRFGYGKERVILEDVSFELGRNDILCLLGPNGTGKTTLLRCLLALNKPARGTIQIDGTDISRMPSRKRAKYMAYVPQAAAMAFPYSAEEIVLMGRIAHLGPGASPTKSDRYICSEMMEHLGLSHLRGKLFNEMSGGERQMLLVARALAQQAQILVMDEPTANLDYSNQVKILRIINQLAEQGYSILMTSHFPDHAFIVGNQVLLMRDGAIMACGPPDEVVTSENLSRLYGSNVHIAEVRLSQEDTTRRVCVPIIKDQLKERGGNRQWEKD